MNRRNFLSSLLAAATLDPERLLWVPGKKTISIPAPAYRPNILIFSAFGTCDGVGKLFSLTASYHGMCLESEVDLIRKLYRDPMFGIIPYKGNEARYETLRGVTRLYHDPYAPPSRPQTKILPVSRISR